MTKKIIVIEDDENIRLGLVDTLESEGFEVFEAENGRKGLEAFNNVSPDLVLLDIMMPQKSGYEVLMEIRKVNNLVPVLMLTAKGEESDKVLGLNLGADDYITKPFGINELIARVHAALRRTDNIENIRNDSGFEDEKFSFAQFDVYPKKYLLKNAETELVITKRELDIIKLFYQKKGEVLSREDLLNKIWGIEYYGTTRTLDQHISMIRKKVEKDPANPRFIKTVHKVGYRYDQAHE